MSSTRMLAIGRPLWWLLAGCLVTCGILLPAAGGESGSPRPRATAPAGGTGVVQSLDHDGDDTTHGDAVHGLRFPRFLRRMEGVPPDPSLPPPADGAREILLTFDDGPNLETTPLVLQELDRRGLKAVFFISGGMLVGERTTDRARRNLVRKLAHHGHMIANHTLSHRDLCQERHPIETEIDGNAEILTAITGLRPVLFRSPYGARCRSLQTALEARGLVNVGWNVDPQEWRGETPEDIARAVIRQIEGLTGGRGIVLLHDTKHATVRALPMILDWIDGQNRLARTPVPTRAPVRPIRVVDYSVFLPSPPLPRTGAEPVLVRLGQDLGTPLPALLGLDWANADFGL